MSSPSTHAIINPDLAYLLKNGRVKALLIAGVIVSGLFVVGQGAMSQFAVNLARSGHWELAATLATAAAKLTNSARDYSRLGDVYLEAQQYNQAAQAFQETLLRDPDYPGAHFKRGRMLFALGDFSRAVSETTAELEQNPNHIKAKYIRGLAYSYLANWSAAEKDFIDLLIVNSDWSWTRIDLSWVYLAQGKYREAENLLRPTVQNNPDSPWALNNLGLALMNQGRFGEAEVLYTQALVAAQHLRLDQFLTAYPLKKPAQFPHGRAELVIGILFNRGVNFERQGELNRAQEVYQSVLALVKDVEAADNASQNLGMSRQMLEEHITELANKQTNG